MGDFSISFLNFDFDKDTTDLVDTMYASSFCPIMNTPTWITATSKTLIDDTFYNDFTQKIAAGNIATSISDHLTQFFIIGDQRTKLEENSKKKP